MMRVIKETRNENHNLRLMMLKEMHDKQVAINTAADVTEAVRCETEDIDDSYTQEKKQLGDQVDGLER